MMKAITTSHKRSNQRGIFSSWGKCIFLWASFLEKLFRR